MTAYDFETWDVFTADKFAGNQLAVLLDASGLTDAQMQTITREFNYAESTFVLPPEDPAHTARVRIFSPGYEMPFAGHPTVGTAIAIAKNRKLTGDLKLELNAGLFPVKVDAGAAIPFAQFQNPNLPVETGLAPAADALEAALGLNEGDIDRDDHRPRRIGAGVDFVCVHAPLDAVRRARLDATGWSALDLRETVGVYLYAKNGEAPDADWHVRMFAPGAGVMEDTATGSAAAALPGQIALSERLVDGAHKWIVEQGVELGRPSRIEVDLETKNGAVTSVAIGGNAVRVTRGQIFV